MDKFDDMAKGYRLAWSLIGMRDEDLATALRTVDAEARKDEHELYLAAHRDNMKGALLLADMRARAEKAESRAAEAEREIAALREERNRHIGRASFPTGTESLADHDCPMCYAPGGLMASEHICVPPAPQDKE